MKNEIKSSFTSGPWAIGCNQNHSVDRFKRNVEWARIRSANGGLIAHIESIHPKGCRESFDFDIEAANARLIATAPELLAALQDLATAAARIVEDDDKPSMIHMRELNRSRQRAIEIMEKATA